ncbi:EAL domain-containing protein [Shewanella cyperi]
MLRLLIAALLIVLIPWKSSADLAHVTVPQYQHSLKFEHFSSSDGLNQNTVTRLFTDSAGMLWIGTQDGLHYYNGQKFNVFLHDPQDPDSISEGYITDIIQDREGHLWIGTFTQGLNKLDLSTGKFSRFGEAQGLTEMGITRLAVISETLWIGTRSGLFSMNLKNGQIRPIPLGNALNPQITALASAGDDFLLVGTRNDGGYAVSSNSITRLKLPGKDSINQIRALDNSNAWIAAGKKLWRYHLDKTAAELLFESRQESFFQGDIRDFDMDDPGEIWAIAPGAGLIELKAKYGWQPQYHRNDSRSIRDISDNNLMSILLDPNGNLWLGGSYSGLDRINVQRQFFEHLFDNSSARPKQINMVRALHQTADGTLWIGTEGAGLKTLKPGAVSYQYRTSLFTQAMGLDDNAISLIVRDIKEDSQGTLWFASNYGLGRLSAEGAFSLLGQEFFSNNMLRNLDIDSKGRLWLAADDGVYLKQTDGDTLTKVVMHNAQGKKVSLRQVLVVQHIDDDLWIGTLEGLHRLEMDTGVVQSFLHQANNPYSLGNNRIRDIVQLSNGEIWLGTHGGIDIATQREGQWQFRHLGDSVSLPSETIYGLLEDSRQRIWFSSNAGVSRFDPRDNSLLTFNEYEGLQEQEYNGATKHRDRYGFFWFGGINGITRFDPLGIPEQRTDARLALTGYAVGTVSHQVLDLSHPPAIVMDYSDKVVNFEVSSLDFSYPGRDRFGFYLQGFDNKWHSDRASPNITYTNLNPGEYILRVRHGLDHNALGHQILSIPLTVKAPLYRTTPAFFSYIIVLLGLLGWLIHARRQKLKQRREFETSIRTSEERLKLALWASGDGMWDWDLTAGKVFRTRMYPHDSQQHEGPVLLDKIHPEDKGRVLMALQAHIDGKKPFYEAEYRIENRPGEWIWLLDRGQVVERDKDNKPLRMVGTHKDITSRKVTENELRLSAQVLASMNEAVVVGSLDYRIASVNPAFSLITGYSGEQAQGKHFLFLAKDRRHRQQFEAIEQKLLRQKHWSGELKIRTKQRQTLLIWLEINQVIDAKGEASHFVAVFTDITDRKRAEEDLRLLASFDPLTKLPNRTLFQDRLNHAISQAHRNETMVALLFLDLDRFKHINDSLGHHVGDLLLKSVAHRLQTCIRDGDTVARLGGDEFTIILEGMTKPKAATLIAEKLIRAFQTPFILEDKVLTISTSIGISLYPLDTLDADSLLKYADTAMYHAKSLGRNNFQFYTAKLNEYAMRHVELEAGLKQAISRQEFRLVYQPKFKVDTGELTGFEALLRWHSAELGNISPGEFIPLAEEIGIINQVGHWVINEACQQMAKWQQQGCQAMHVAVNLSARQLKADILSTIEVALAVAGLPAHFLQLELTESMIMKNPQESVAVLSKLKALGLTLAVDDFGTGYSSLSYLKRFPIDVLKIDREFVRDISNDPEDAAITSAIIALAHSLDLTVVAEGVETEEQLRFLAQQECDEVQGFLLGKPMSAEECGKLLLSVPEPS